MPNKNELPGTHAAPGTSSGSDFVAPYVNKIVKFRFMGKDATFRLSHALFSSFDIDEGTRRLLKSIAQHVPLAPVRSCLDLGCGVGVIGICIQLARPEARILLQDRDALAVAFASENARANGCPSMRADCGLAFAHLDGETFDLIVSNLPAKAGRPVLQSFFLSIRARLAPGGTACVVIVAPLSDLALSLVREAGAELLFSEIAKDYTVLHFRFSVAPVAVPETRDDLSPYMRTEKAFTHGETTWLLRTAWSLPDFDTLSYSLSLSFDLLSESALRGEALVWNPGQGHIPAFLVAQDANTVTGTTLAARDSLELAITERSLRAGGHEVRGVYAVPSVSALPGTLARASFDVFAAVPQTIPRIPWQQEVRDAALFLLKPGGWLFVVSTSTEMHRFLEGPRGLRLVESRKRLGCRAALLQRL